MKGSFRHKHGAPRCGGCLDPPPSQREPAVSKARRRQGETPNRPQPVAGHACFLRATYSATSWATDETAGRKAGSSTPKSDKTLFSETYGQSHKGMKTKSIKSMDREVLSPALKLGSSSVTLSSGVTLSIQGV